ncbi:hypothetical protein [Nannocystis bainbridge]|uniref:Uncharacterized protein n=1 Tax=Nannocystis bainbridge TaxID=2995303 RepID=A0ABT5DUU5_9BACT|nr:hypothetical protein [Nannocystis bainbridge]MDC0716493.1 hypothetical protein [Nannocystis bainbridge]
MTDTSTPLPRFGLDHEHYAALVIGRPATVEGSFDGLAAIHARFATLSAELGLPVAFIAGARVEEDEDHEVEGVVGLVLAVARFGDRPATPEGALLQRHAVADVPDAVWTAARELGLTLGEDTGLFLAAGGWSVATLHAGEPDDMGWDASSGRDWPGEIVGKKLASASADGTPYRLLTAEVIAAAAASPCLSASYA